MLASLANRVRKIVNAEARRRGYALRWIPPRALARRGGELGVSFRLLAADLMLRTPRPFFINIGANDGVTVDPIYPFVRDFGWHGIMVEPLPEAFAALRRNYADFSGITFVQAAMGPAEGKRTLYTLDADHAGALKLSAYASFSRELLLAPSEWHPSAASAIVEREVAVVSFATLLANVAPGSVDVLKIDTEGYDLEVLRGFDFSRYEPRLVIAEHANLSRDDATRMADLLLDHGYRITMTSLDMLAYRDEG